MKAIIYGKVGCPECEQTKRFCETNGIRYDYHLVGTDIQKEKLFEMIGHEVRSVPQIFINSDGMTEYVGNLGSFKIKVMSNSEI